MFRILFFSRLFLGLLILLIIGINSSTIAYAQIDRIKWMAVGSLQSWYLKSGCEPEVARRGLVSDQIDGLRWPAEYQWKDVQAAKSLWIGTVNYYDTVAHQVFPHKVVHVGPRVWDDANEFMPQEFNMIGRFDHPLVLVNGELASNLMSYESLDGIIPTLEADRMILNKIITSIGIEMTRKIYAFSQQYHDNYFINEYIFKNTGQVHENGTMNPQTLDGLYFHWQYRYAVCREMGAYGLFIMPQSATWGHNTMNDARGEDPGSGDPFRALFSWHGLHSFAAFDNIGAPNIQDNGRLTSSQIVGVVTLHADKSGIDKTDDPFQPTTTQYIGSDEAINYANDQYNPAKMSQEYIAMSSGHPAVRHADAVGYCSTCYADQFGGTPGGYSQAHGFGPYTLEIGDSIRIFLAEGVAGLSRDKNIEIGDRWFNETQPYILPDGSTTTDKDEYKNTWVYTGKDSLFQTFIRAIDNFSSGFSIPQPPPPPDVFEVLSGTDHINLSWSSNAESWPGFAGYGLFRAIGRFDTTYVPIFECNFLNLANSFKDSTVEAGKNYYYFVQSFDDGSTNNIHRGFPLVSSKFYTMTNKPAYLLTTGLVDAGENELPDAFGLGRNYPNPFNPNTQIIYHIPKTTKVKLEIYNSIGQRIRTLVDQIQNAGSHKVQWDGNNDFGVEVSSGIYLYSLTTDGFKQSRTMILLR